MLYFSKYVNENAKQLRNAFVSHKGKKILKVTIEGNNPYCQKNWEEFLDKMIDEIKDNTAGKVTDHLECNFTTTDKFAKIMSTATIMSTFQKFFEY